MADNTANYNLKLWDLANDIISLVKDNQRSNMTTIDGQMKTSENNIGSLQTQINNLIIDSGTSDAETIQARGAYATLLVNRLDAVQMTSDPTVTDDQHEVGKFWINTTDDGVFILANNATGAAVWLPAGNGAQVAQNTADIATNVTDIAELNGMTTYTTVGGTANALTASTIGGETFDDSKDGNPLPIKPILTNTGSATINVDSIGVKDIKKFDIDTDGYVNVEAGDIKKNTQTVLRWDLAEDFFVLTLSGSKVLDGDNEALSISDDGTTLKFLAPKGQYNGVDVNVTYTDANFTSDNIPQGIIMFDKTGTGSKQSSGTGALGIAVNLGYQPDYVMIEGQYVSSDSYNVAIMNMHDAVNSIFGYADRYSPVGGGTVSQSVSVGGTGITISSTGFTVSTTITTKNTNSSFDYSAGKH